MFDGIDKESELDEETRNVSKEIENREKVVDKKGFIKYFSYEPTELVNNLLSQNKQGLRKSLDEIKQGKIELNKDERNSRNNKNKNDTLNTILSAIDRTNDFFQHKFLLGE